MSNDEIRILEIIGDISISSSKEYEEELYKLLAKIEHENIQHKNKRSKNQRGKAS